MSSSARLPAVVDAPPRGRVLVLAPHPDDETIGAGGTLALHARQGDRVDVIFTFDGRLGLPPGSDPLTRRREAHAALAHLGAQAASFLDHPEGHEPSRDERNRAAASLAADLASMSPRTVYLPWPGEGHVDHAVVAQVALEALELSGSTAEAFGYEVWTPLAPDVVVDVTSTWPAKLAALREYRSQLAHTDFERSATGLAAHRSLHLPRKLGFAEAFARLWPRGAS